VNSEWHWMCLRIVISVVDLMNTFIRQNDRDRQEENAREHIETIKQKQPKS